MQINRPQCSHSVDKFSILNGVQVFLCQLLLILIGIHLSIYPSIHPFIHLSILFVAYVFSFFSARLSVWFHFNYYTRLLPPTRFYLYKFFTLAVVVLFGFLFRDKARYTNELWLWLWLWDLAIKRLVVWRVRLPPRGVLWAQPRKQKKNKKKTHSKPKHNPLPPPQIQDVIRTVEWDLRTYEYKLLGSPVA